MAICHTISELIAELQRLQQQHGDISVTDSYDEPIQPEKDTDANVIVVCDKA